MKLPVKLLRNGGRPLAASGETRNLSSHGVLFASDVELPLDESIEYVITFPANQTASLPVDLHCLGKVVRFERQGAAGPAFEIAATLERYEFVRVR